MNYKKQIALFCVMLSILVSSTISAQTWVKVAKDPELGWRLLVNGETIAIHGMVWSFTPIGENYSWSLWDKSEDYIQRTIDTDAVLLREMGVNVIRTFSDIPPKWITYLYERYKIYTIINNLFGRYGMSVDGRWMEKTDYSDLRTRELILKEVREIVEIYKDVPGLLFYLLGNENNYGLEWDSDKIEDLPVGQRLEVRAGYLYSLFEEGIQIIKEIDPTKPVGIVNGDIQYLNIIKALIPSLDILGVNTYRGNAAYDLFYQSVASTLDLPIVFTELGADAYNIKTEREDQFHQAEIIRDQWQEIYEQSYGKGRFQNVLGAFVFQWLDEWWKHGQTEELSKHNRSGTWANSAYEFDSMPGKNNMNEEWFGIIALSTVLEGGISQRIPRATYYLLQDAWKLDQITSTAEEVSSHFASLNLWDYTLHGESNAAANKQAEEPVLSVSGSITVLGNAVINDVALELSNNKVKEAIDWTHGEWSYLNLDLSILKNLRASTTFRVQGAVPPTTFIQEEYSRFSQQDTGDLPAIAHLEIYSAHFSYESELFDLDGYLHNGHSDWVSEGDIFNLLPESFDLLGMDLDNSRAPFGVEFTGKQLLDGLKIYAGPEPYWGASPQAFIKYYRPGNVFSWAAIWNETFAMEDPEIAVGGYDRRISLYAKLDILPYIQVDLGVLHANSEKLGLSYDHVNSDGTVSNNEKIDVLDTFSARLELTSTLLFYTTLRARYVFAGRVASTNPFTSRTGSQIVDLGTGNRHELYLGIDFVAGPFTISPAFLMRQPLSFPAGTSGTRPREPLSDPFFVWQNRETYQLEFLATFDPTGDTYFHAWNADEREHSKFAMSASLLYTLKDGATDPNWFYTKNGTPANFNTGLPSATNLWSLKIKAITNPFPNFRAIVNLRSGTGQSWGEDTRLVTYYGGTLDLRFRQWFLSGDIAINDWGREDWYRNFNITFPLQWSLEIARAFSLPSFIGSENRIGLRWMGTTHDQYDPNNPKRKWTYEMRAYFQLMW